MNYLLVDYDHIPTKVKIYQKGTLVQKWSEKEPIKLIHRVIDDLDDTAFEKIKMKQKLAACLEVFEPKSIRIVENKKGKR